MPQVDLKVVLLGKHDVGKSSLAERFLHGKFSENISMTVGAAFGAKQLTVEGKSVTLGIWDTAGAERYESMSRMYYKSAGAAVVCYDVTNPHSFDKVKFWVNELSSNEEGCIIAIAATKTDLLGSGGAGSGGEGSGGVDPAVAMDDVKQYANSIGAFVVETSAKDGTNIDVLFTAVAAKWARKPRATPKPYSPSFKVEAHRADQQQRGACC